MSTETELDTLAAEFAALLAALIPDIGDEYRAYDDDTADSEPSMLVTFGVTQSDDGHLSWSYQTGDNSFTGGAYGHPDWAVVALYRDSDTAALAEDAVGQIADALPEVTP